LVAIALCSKAIDRNDIVRPENRTKEAETFWPLGMPESGGVIVTKIFFSQGLPSVCQVEGSEDYTSFLGLFKPTLEGRVGFKVNFGKERIVTKSQLDESTNKWRVEIQDLFRVDGTSLKMNVYLVELAKELKSYLKRSEGWIGKKPEDKVWMFRAGSGDLHKASMVKELAAIQERAANKAKKEEERNSAKESTTASAEQ